MPRTIKCTNCGVALNIPEEGIGRRLKCPKCSTKFFANDPGAAASSAAIGLHDADPASSQDVVRRSQDDLPIPTAPGDLRGTFDLPLMTDEERPPSRPSAPVGDAHALFQDEKPLSRRRPTGAEARARARRCPTCGGHVPTGMSICSTCGLDLETGLRVGLEDDLTPPPPVRPSGPPIGVLLVGGLCLLLSIILSFLALIRSARGTPGFGYFVPVALFGVFASIQFLRGKSAKFLLFALTLGALVDVGGLIVLPILEANMEVRVQERHTADPDLDEVVIQPIQERFDLPKLIAGIAVLVVYAFVSVYLMSPAVNRHLRR